MEKELLQWHPGFYAAFGAEVGEVKGKLRLQNEYPLGTKPIVIDILAVKEAEKEPLTKNIIQIFQKHNIIEYKNPEESLSANDYYKALAYACYYIADTEHVLEIKPHEVTITFVCNRYPRELFRHLRKRYDIQVKEEEQGIYYLQGSRFPVQVIVSHKLDPKKNLWLYSLRGNLTEEEIKAVLEDYRKHKEERWYHSAMGLITRANWDRMKKGGPRMCEELWELCQEMFADEFEKREETARELGEKYGMEIGEKRGMELGEKRGMELGEKRGMEIGKRRGMELGRRNSMISLINKKLTRGKSEEVIAEELEEDVSVIHELIEGMMQASN